MKKWLWEYSDAIMFFVFVSLGFAALILMAKIS